MKHNKKGQAAIIGVLFSVILIGAMAILMSPLLNFIDIGINASENFTNGGLMVIVFHSYPIMILLVGLVAIVMMILGRLY